MKLTLSITVGILMFEGSAFAARKEYEYSFYSFDLNSESSGHGTMSRT